MVHSWVLRPKTSAGLSMQNDSSNLLERTPSSSASIISATNPSLASRHSTTDLHTRTSSFPDPTGGTIVFRPSNAAAQSSSSSLLSRDGHRNKLKLGIEEARGVASAMMRRATGRPVDRLSTHDSTLGTVASASDPQSRHTQPLQKTHKRSSQLVTPGMKMRSMLRTRFHQRRNAIISFETDDGQRLDVPAGDIGLLPCPSSSSRVVVTTGHQKAGPSADSADDVLAGGSAARAAAAEHNIRHPRDWRHHSPGEMDGDSEDSDIPRPTSKRRRGAKGKSLSVDSDSARYSPENESGVDELTGDKWFRPRQGQDIIGKMPTELAAQIMSFLDDVSLARCNKVSRRWHEIASSPAVWRSAFLGRYARAEDNAVPYIQFGGQGLGRDSSRQRQEWKKMAVARRRIEKNWHAMNPRAVYFQGHTDSVYCCQFDEDKIITGSRDRTIRIWSIRYPYECLKVIGGPSARPQLPVSDTSLETHPTQTVWQTPNLNGTPAGEALYHVPDDYHTASILCLQFDKDIMVTGSSDHTCIVWSMETFQPLHRLRQHSAGVLDVCMDDEYIISCSKDAHICVWDRKTLQLIKALHGHRGPVNAVQLRTIKGKKLLVSASGDGLAKIWDLEKLEVKCQFNSQDRGLAAVEFSDDGRYVLAGGNDQVIYKFETDTGRLVHTFRGHSSLVRSLFLDSANGRVISGSYDQGIRVYDFDNGELIGSYDNWTTSWILAAKGDYRRIVATSQDGRALLMDYGHEVKDVELLACHGGKTDTLPDRPAH